LLNAAPLLNITRRLRATPLLKLAPLLTRTDFLVAARLTVADFLWVVMCFSLPDTPSCNARLLPNRPAGSPYWNQALRMCNGFLSLMLSNSLVKFLYLTGE
jgi:hypothetical protein